MSEHVFELLPWFINGRLSAHQQTHVTEHLAQCNECCKELALQQRLSAAITSPGKIELAPQPAFNKLWDKILAAENEITSALDHPQPGFSLRAVTGDSIRWLAARWMPLALSVQAAAIAVLLAVVLVKQHADIGNAGDAYRTVTSSAIFNITTIHVVFDDATRVSDIKDILVKSNLQVAAGPTTAGVYSLTPASRQVEFNAQEAIRSLRDDPRVRFAELSHR